MVAGDINGEIADFESLADMMGQHGWTDAGAMQHICPQGVCMPTCRVSGVAQAIRRDYVLVNEYLLPAVVECKVCYDDTFPTHSPVRVAIASAKVPTQRRRLRQVDSAAIAIQEKIQSCIGDKTGKEATEENKVQVERLHAYMNMELEKRTDRMQEAQEQADAHRLWDLITAAVEESFVRYLELAGQKALCMKGRSKVQIVNTQLRGVARTRNCKAEKPKVFLYLQRSAGIHRAQMNRLLNVARRMVSRARRRVNRQTGKDDIGKRQKVEVENHRLNRSTVEAYLAQACRLHAEAEAKIVEARLGDRGRDVQLGDEWMEEHFGIGISRECVREVLTIDIGEKIHAAKAQRLADKNKQCALKLEARLKIAMQQEARRQHDEPLTGASRLGKKLDAAAAPPLQNCGMLSVMMKILQLLVGLLMIEVACKRCRQSMRLQIKLLNISQVRTPRQDWNLGSYEVLDIGSLSVLGMVLGIGLCEK